MDRFFVDPSQITVTTVTFSPSQASQLARVLRLRVGDHVLALDNHGACYEVALTSVTHTAASGAIVSRSDAEGEPVTPVVLYQALLKGPKWEYVLQKCTEVGVAAFVPLITQRCVALYEADRWADRTSRWEAITREAAEQSGRGRIPAIDLPQEWKHALGGKSPHRLLLHPSGGPLSAVLENVQAKGPLSLFVGPEGGFTDDEVAQAAQSGMHIVTLGKRTLRAETAGLVAAAAVLYALGEME